MKEQSTCPQCGDEKETFTEFSEDELSSRQVGGKKCDGCGFKMYDYGDSWEW